MILDILTAAFLVAALLAGGAALGAFSGGRVEPPDPNL